MYVARFALGGAPFCVAALTPPVTGHSLLPGAWRAPLLASHGCGFALRLQRGGVGAGTRLFVNAAGESEAEFQGLTARLNEAALAAEGARCAASPEEFNILAGGVPGYQLWLNHRGYEFRQRPLATDFRLFPLLGHLATLLAPRGSRFLYQCNLRYHPTDREEERAVRKYNATLRLDADDLPRLVRDLQGAIASRLLQPSFAADELLAVDDAVTLGIVSTAVEEHFAETAGPFGFRTSPLESGNYEELFLTGLHSSHFLGDGHFLATAAAALALADVQRLLESPDILAASAESPPVTGSPGVFISYSSSEFTQAWLVCRFLEASGIPCWIAPRNILPGEAYPEAIMRGIAGARALVVLVSASSNLSPHVHREIERALHRRAVIIPVRVQDMQPTGTMEYLLSTCHWLDAIAEPLEPALTQLRDRLRALLDH